MVDIFSKIKTHNDAVEQIKMWQQAGDKVVFTNGCFDLIHRGHVEYLNKAAEKGDKLILGLNSDASVKRLKGETRPIIDEESRAILLAAFQFIDMVVLFNEDTPYNLINALKPNCLVKGGDYKAKDMVGYDIVIANGGSVESLDFIEGFSTSNIIEKIASELNM